MLANSVPKKIITLVLTLSLCMPIANTTIFAIEFNEPNDTVFLEEVRRLESLDSEDF